jgi:hypothetical protein
MVLHDFDAASACDCTMAMASIGASGIGVF